MRLSSKTRLGVQALYASAFTCRRRPAEATGAARPPHCPRATPERVRPSARRGGRAPGAADGPRHRALAVAVGDQAPNFTLADAHGTPVTLSSYAGRQYVVLVFYPFAFSGICTGELREIRLHASLEQS